MQGDQELKIQTKCHEEHEQGTRGLRFQNTNKMQWKDWARHKGFKVSKQKTKCKENSDQGTRVLKIQSANMWRTQLNHKGIRCNDQG